MKLLLSSNALQETNKAVFEFCAGSKALEPKLKKRLEYITSSQTKRVIRFSRSHAPYVCY